MNKRREFNIWFLVVGTILLLHVVLLAMNYGSFLEFLEFLLNIEGPILFLLPIFLISIRMLYLKKGSPAVFTALKAIPRIFNAIIFFGTFPMTYVILNEPGIGMGGFGVMIGAGLVLFVTNIYAAIDMLFLLRKKQKVPSRYIHYMIAVDSMVLLGLPVIMSLARIFVR